MSRFCKVTKWSARIQEVSCYTPLPAARLAAALVRERATLMGLPPRIREGSLNTIVNIRAHFWQ